MSFNAAEFHDRAANSQLGTLTGACCWIGLKLTSYVLPQTLAPMALRTFLLFLYGTGARVHEAIGLRIQLHSPTEFR
jgi:integrase